MKEEARATKVSIMWVVRELRVRRTKPVALMELIGRFICIKRRYRSFQRALIIEAKGRTPPVLIVLKATSVASVSTLDRKYAAGELEL